MPHPPRAGCDEGRTAAARKPTDRPRFRAASRATRRVWLLVSVLGMILAGSLWLHRRSPPTPEPGPPYTAAHAHLLAANWDRFPFEPRLSGTGQGAHELDVFQEGKALGFAGEGLGRRVRAEAEIERALANGPSAEALAAAGVRNLLDGHTDQAIVALETARLGRPADYRIANDLAVAYLVRGLEENRSLDLLDALALADEAMKQDPPPPEALFNHAYALDSFYLRGPARRAWEAYVEVDPQGSTWSEIARRRLKVLGEPLAYERWAEVRGDLRAAAFGGDSSRVRELVSEFPAEVLEDVETWLLEEWPRSVEKGDRQGEQAILEAVKRVGPELAPEVGGRLLLGALAHLDSLGSVSARAALAKAYADLRRGLAAINRFEIEEALGALERAVPSIAGQESPYLPRTHLLLAICRYQGLGYAQAKSLLLEVLRGAEVVEDLKARIDGLLLLGNIEGIENRIGPALEHYTVAHDLATAAGWRSRVAAAEGSIAGAFDFLGDDSSAWRHRLGAFEALGWVSQARIRARIWHDATDAARSRAPELASYFADELIVAAEELNHPLVLAVALEERALVLHLAGETGDALKDLAAADQWIDHLRDPALIETRRGSLLVARGEMLAREHGIAAASPLDQAVELFRKTKYELGLARALQLRAQTYRSLDAPDQALVDLEEAIEKIETMGRSVAGPRERIALLAEARHVYDEMVGLQMQQGRPEEALHFSERGRWPLGAGVPREWAPVRESAERLPTGTVVVAYRVLPDRLLVWVLRRGSLTTEQVPVVQDEVIRRVRAFRRAIQWGSSIESHAESLYDLLLGSIHPALDGASELVVVADDALDGVPFAALRDPVSHRYLVQDLVISGSLSVAGAIGARSDGAEASFGRTAQVLAVGDPTPSPAVGLPALPQSAAEARGIEQQFPRTTLLLNESASELRLFEEAPRHEILHFAGHVLGNAREPLLAHLVLAPEGGTDGSLYAYEIARRPLQGVRLAVLSGCGSGAGAGSTTSLAGSFLEAGVPRVIASLWDVTDRPTADFFKRFYTALRSGASPVLALRSSQLAFLESEDPDLGSPATWAAFRAIHAGAGLHERTQP